jgi:F-type H+-transporting ATPase subunit epsilon
MADEKTFLFEVLMLQGSFTPTEREMKWFFREQVRFVIAPGQEGVFEILPNHARFVFGLKPGVLRIRMPDGKDRYLAASGGVLVVQADRTTLLARSAEKPEQIDVTRARRAKERAEERLQKASDMNMARAQASLQRALARLKVAEYAVVAK